MHLIDWILVAVPLLLVFGIAAYTRRYMKSVVDFLSGGRMAGRYLLCVSRAEMGAGAVVFAAAFEVISKSGFTMNWWGNIGTPIALLTTITGFVGYRYRETRAMTLAQFFEIRYSRRFRLFTGMVGFLAGLVNFGIIPAVGSRFIVYFVGLPPTLHLFSTDVPTYIPLMAGLLSISWLLTVSGGLITSMVANCMEGMISQMLYLVLIVAMLTMFNWKEVSEMLSNRPAGLSLLNPFDSLGIQDFNLSASLMGLIVGVYGTMAWQNASSYNSASLSAHEGRMGSILGWWQGSAKGAVVTLLAICAMTYLYHPDFSSQAAVVQAEVAQIPQKQIQQQMLIPVTLSHILPVGLKGAFCVILLMGIFGGDSTHLHSWGSLFIQDVVVPLRKKPLSPEQHVWLLRMSVTGVALFAFLFGSLFRQTEYISMWFSVTMGLYIGGAGSVIIGGLYWKKGTTAGAWSAMLTGSLLSGGGILARQFYGTGFPMNGIQISFTAVLCAVTIYVVVSLLTNKQDFNMDRMLHRGKYALDEPKAQEESKKTHVKKIIWSKLIGIDENFTFADKCLAIFLFFWTMFWFSIFLIGTTWNLISPWPTKVWSLYWQIQGVGIPIILAVVTTIWFTWGGLRDMRLLFKRLREEKVNVMDNGMVVNHQNMADLKPQGQLEAGKEPVGPAR